ncbi:hypothetical protein CPB85DRAFT_1266034 [Mucidula mucida]|nr:hypothetical protein CPB85DRAFT_1266034 [Mucidula mucida]
MYVSDILRSFYPPESVTNQLRTLFRKASTNLMLPVISDVVEIAIIFQRLKFLPSYEFLHLSGLDFASVWA